LQQCFQSPLYFESGHAVHMKTMISQQSWILGPCELLPSLDVCPSIKFHTFGYLLYNLWANFKVQGRVKQAYNIGIFCFSLKHVLLRSKSKDWLAGNRLISLSRVTSLPMDCCFIQVSVMLCNLCNFFSFTEQFLRYIMMRKSYIR
jgi:hypothetical protein